MSKEVDNPIEKLANELSMTEWMKEMSSMHETPWTDEGDGFMSLIAIRDLFHGNKEDRQKFFNKLGQSGLGDNDDYMKFKVAYVALPVEWELTVEERGAVHNVNVNGGVTFREGNVFGWDYGHAYNPGVPKEDIKEAVRFFKDMYNKSMGKGK
ncbi:MAG: hypothetical protein D4S01_06305 [Dehalococcoidia bacterium]|nr:MAG: hypothetical protein D4S01_06305 [Dehalococcoidia bacterium]